MCASPYTAVGALARDAGNTALSEVDRCARPLAAGGGRPAPDGTPRHGRSAQPYLPAVVRYGCQHERMETLTTRRLNRATLARQMLLARERSDVVTAVERLGGMQAQEARHPFTGLWTRLEGFRREDMHRALHDRLLVRA